MCQLFGYTLSDSSLLQLALNETGDALRAEASPETGDDFVFDGWGLGFYQDDRPLLRKQPTPTPTPVSFVELASDIRSTSVIGHLQHDAHDGKGSENMQPFRFRNWLFASLSPENDTLYNSLHARLPDFLKRNLRGQTCSEAILHLFFDHLRKRARVESAVLPPRVLFETACSLLAELATLTHDETPARERPDEISMLFASGRMLFAINASERPWAVLKTQGLQEREAPLFAGHQPRTLSYPEFRGVCVAFEPAPSELPWQYLPPHHFVAIDERFQIHIEPIAKANVTAE